MTGGARATQILRFTQRAHTVSNILQATYGGYQGLRTGNPVQVGFAALGLGLNGAQLYKSGLIGDTLSYARSWEFDPTYIRRLQTQPLSFAGGLPLPFRRRRVSQALYGREAELLGAATLQRAGYENLGDVQYSARFGDTGTNGFDGVFIKRSAAGGIEDIVVLESKLSVNRRLSSVRLGIAGPELALQGTKRYVRYQIQQMLSKRGTYVGFVGQLLDDNFDKIRYKLNVLDIQGVGPWQTGVNRWNVFNFDSSGRFVNPNNPYRF